MTERKYTNRRYLDALQQRVMVFDGAMGTNIQRQNLTAEQYGGEKTVGCNDYLVITYPLAVEKVHRSFLEVGVDVIETCTFRSNRITLAEYGLADRVVEINRTAAQLARRLADEYSTSDQPRFVAGSMGPSGKLLSMDDPLLSNVTYDEIAGVFKEQALGLIEGGVDLLLIETSQDILEVKAIITGIGQAFSESGVYLPIQAQVTLDTNGHMLLGTDIQAVMTILQGLPIDVIGLNCSTGPDHMREPIRVLGEQACLPVSCIPNAGLPMNVDGQAVYPLLPEPFADTLTEYIEKYKISVVGGCCGTTPEHLQKLVEKVHNMPHPERPTSVQPMLASSVSAVPMQQEPRPFLIGERLNAQGSAKFKKILLEGDLDSILSIARQQVNFGAHGLDVCVALTERGDETQTMQAVIRKLATVVRAPFIIDSTEPDVMEAALKTAPGRCILNSTNLEAGRAKADRVFNLARQYNAAVMALTIDEQGMARTADRKAEIAARLYEIAVREHGLNPGDLIIDALTFTLATGQVEFAGSALETFEGIRRIKANLPGVLTSLGVSNCSFGLKPNARGVINSVMLYHAVQAGLDMAIVNPIQIVPYMEIPAEERTLAEDLIFNRHPDALARLIEYFTQAGESAENPAAQKNPLEGLNAGQRLHWRILHRVKDDVEADIDELLSGKDGEVKSQEAVNVLNTVLLPAMKEVGDKFGSGELILPFVLQSAEVMKKSVTHLENYLDRKEGTVKGTMVLATVYGDVHDIGKNLVKTILSNNGYNVIDLGKQVPAETILAKAVDVHADAIGLSALLVSTSRQMPLIVNELQRRKLNFPVLIGGAAINQRFGRRILKTEDGEYYQPGVYYCRDAFACLSTMDALMNPETRPSLMQQIQQEADFEDQPAGRNQSGDGQAEVRTGVAPAERIPTPPGWGVRQVTSMPLPLVFDRLTKNELFRLSWGAKNTHGEEWEKMKAEFEVRLADMQKQAEKERWLAPQGVYGYWPAQADGNDLILYDPQSVQTGRPVEIERFSFPRQKDGDQLCLADYFAGVSSGRMDVAALQIATVGKAATERFDRLQAEGNYTEAYYVHGLAVQTAEAAAEYLHAHIRRELNLEPEQGKRYSWGYPAIPELADHKKVFSLLKPDELLGMSLTAAYQLVPEQSTAAIILHHPAAKYFNLGESRVDQIMKG
jgi:5-methyltetrahydrofolate--homocysteine methyltransferase